MDISKDYYAILGVLPVAEEIVIRAAYKALAQRYHPDRFENSGVDAQERMKDINEAYSVLSDQRKRQEYDKSRGSNTQPGDSYFHSEADDIPPSFDPLEKDWTVASKYYTDLKDIDARLGKISWRLSYAFRAYIIEEKAFENREKIAEQMESQFLSVYFGSNPSIIGFARCLIAEGQKPAAKALNEAVRIFGSKIDPNRVIKQIQGEFLYPSPETEKATMLKYGISYDGEHYCYQDYRYDKLSDAVTYAKIQQSRSKSR